MKIQKLQLENFRNYQNYIYEFNKNKNCTVFIGENGKGKTNFLEALYILSLGRSFRTLFYEDIIKWGESYMKIKGEIEEENEEKKLEVFFENSPIKKKNLKKNDVNLKNSEYIGTFLTVLFHPEDLNMLYLGPKYRRRYMDILLSQSDKNYLFALSKYQKILKQRNSLLFGIKEKRFKKMNTENLEEDLDAWDFQIAKFGSIIFKKREELVIFLNEKVNLLYKKISGKEEEIKIKYITNNKKDETEYLKELKSKREREIAKERTLIGPHLDDLKFYINDNEITSSASRGEFRTLILAIKLSEIDFIEQKTKSKPILLLDDVFSELDRTRRGLLIKTIKDHQTIITSTDIAMVKDLIKQNSNTEVVRM